MIVASFADPEGNRVGLSSGVQELATAGQGPSLPIPSDADPNVPWPALIRPTAVEPKWSDFQIDGRPLYEEVAAYFEATGKLLSEAHKIAEEVHGSNTLSEPAD